MPARAALVAVWFVVTALAHLEFSLWLVRQRPGNAGMFAWSQLVPVLVVAGAVALAALLLIRLRDARRPWTLLAAWAALGGAVWLIDRYLTFSANEYAHYPQYGLLAWLIAWMLDPRRTRVLPGRAILWATVLGMLDELQQYVWIAPQYGEYLDFNDFLVNLVAACGGVLLYYGGTVARGTVPERRLPRRELAFCGGVAAVVLVATLSGRVALLSSTEVPAGGIAPDAAGRATLYLQRKPGLYDSRLPGPRRGDYFVLGPVSGSACLALGALFAAGLARSLRSGAAERRG